MDEDAEELVNPSCQADSSQYPLRLFSRLTPAPAARIAASYACHLLPHLSLSSGTTGHFEHPLATRAHTLRVLLLALLEFC